MQQTRLELNKGRSYRAQYEENDIITYCDSCGKDLDRVPKYPWLESQKPKEYKFCPYCGSKL